MGYSPAALAPVKRRAHFIGGWVCARAGLEGWGKSHPHRDSIPGLSSLYLVAIMTLFRPINTLKVELTLTKHKRGEAVPICARFIGEAAGFLHSLLNRTLDRGQLNSCTAPFIPRKNSGTYEIVGLVVFRDVMDFWRTQVSFVWFQASVFK